MSTRVRAPARVGRSRAARGARTLVVLIPLLVLLAAGAASAGPGEPLTHLSATAADEAGVAVGLIHHPISGGPAVVEVRLPGRAPGAQVLAAASDGSSIAIADPYGMDRTSLVLAHADGSQVRVEMHGLLAAGYAPTGSWLAVIDGRGGLWEVQAISGEARYLADGPFLGSPLVEADGSLLLLSVSSVEAPITSQLVELDPAAGTLTQRAAEELVYGLFPMADGRIAVSAHVDGRTVVRAIGGDRDDLLADLGAGATQVAVSAQGTIAFVRPGAGVLMLDRRGAAARPLAPGSGPAFDASGSYLTVRQDGWSVVLAVDGSTVGRYPGAVAFVSCGEECS